MLLEDLAVSGSAGETNLEGDVFHGQACVPQKGEGSVHPAGVQEGPQGAAEMPGEGTVEHAFGNAGAPCDILDGQGLRQMLPDVGFRPLHAVPVGVQQVFQKNVLDK